MARIELGEEFRSIEDIIEARDEARARQVLDEMSVQLGRRPEYRYLRLLYETTFSRRSDGELLADTRELVAEQPDLAEATALLALLFSRVGDRVRADLFAREAMASLSPSAQLRASQILGLKAPIGTPPTSRAPTSRRRTSAAFEGRASSSSASLHRPPSPRPPPPPARTSVVGGRPSGSGAAPLRGRSGSSAASLGGRPGSSAASLGGRPGPPASADVESWFEQARRERLVPRHATHGVKVDKNQLVLLLDWGRMVMLGQAHFAPSALPLSRDGLEQLDAIIAERRRARAQTGAPREEPSSDDIDAVGGFFLAVALHELDAHALETAPADGFCKIVLPTGAGLRPLAVASAFLSGSGPSLTQSFDRLVTVQSPSLVTARPPSTAPPARPPSLAPPASSAPPPSPPLGGTPTVPPSQDELALTRPEVELATVRRLRRPTRSEPPPNIDLTAVAAAFAGSPEGLALARSSGSERLLPVPQAVTLLEAHAGREWAREGLAPHIATWLPPDNLEETIVAWGAFIGESIIAAYGGVWECDPNAPSDPHLFRVVCNDQVVAWPIAQVYLRLKNGVRFSLSDFIGSIGRLF